jgi:CRP-like cAMP-binding protein
MLTPSDAAVLEAGKWFSNLPASLAGSLLDAAEVVHLQAGALLFARGDANNGIYGVLQGVVRFGAASASGRESVVALAQASHWFGEVSMFGGRRTHDAWAETHTRLAWVRRQPLQKLLADDPAMWKYLGQLLSHKLELAFEILESTALKQPKARLAELLLGLATGYHQRNAGVQLKLRISQERLGTLLSFTRQTTNALLGMLEREGAIRVSRGSVQILDVDRLRALSE